MSRSPGQPVVTVKPQANVYTVLLIAAILVLAVTVGLVINNLTAPVEGGQGYGMEFAEMFEPLDMPGSDS